VTTDLKPYPAMKDSGVPWLEKVPRHWQILPNRALFIEVKERDYPDEQMLSVTIAKGVIRQQTLLADSVKKDSSNQDKSAYKVVRPEDIVYNKMRAWQGAIGRSEYRGIVSPAYVVQRPREGADSRYLHYLLRIPAFAKEAERWSYGITSDMWSLRPEHFKMIHACLPPVPEQSAIVRFLDHADRRIRRYIRAKQKLIKLLEDQKQSIIRRAVTRGLDPNVRLKPSGVEWLGDVPEHWEVRRAKYFYREVDNRSVTGDEELLSVSHVTGVTPRSEKNITMFMASSYVGHKLCQHGDLVINTMWAWMGALGIARQTGLVSPSYGVYRPIRGAGLLGGYADSLLRTKPYVSEYFSRSTGIRSSRLRLYPEEFLRIRIVCPPSDEQRTIVSRLAAETADTRKAIARAEREIALVREYGTGLIADVVTGKFDVREAAAALPEETDEDEASDSEVEIDENIAERNGEDAEAELEAVES
jgi:type I restriction enzyme, S subunit